MQYTDPEYILLVKIVEKSVPVLIETTIILFIIWTLFLMFWFAKAAQ